MKLSNSASRIPRRWLSGSIVAALVALVGLLLLLSPIGGGVTRFSYDLPFALRADRPPGRVALVYLDEMSHNELKQPVTAPWDRSLHARLVDRLTADGAKAIVFDILFTEPSTNAAADAQFAQAIKRSGRVILGGNFNQRETTRGAQARGEELPYEPLRAGAVAWGNANLLPDPDYGVRRFFPDLQNVSGQTNIPWLPRVVANFIKTTPHPQFATERWLNYYGPPGTLPSVSYFLALLPEGVPPGFFKDKIVFVGGLLSADFSGKGKDEFRTPYAFWGKGFAAGVEIHATAALNLILGDCLTRLVFPVELALVLVIGALAGFGLMRFQPLVATLLALAALLVIASVAHLMVWHKLIWFGWLIPAVQVTLALFCSTVLNSLALYIEKRLLEESLAAQLSPKLVKRLMKDPALRRPGGSQQEVSILFSDIANFARVSETMRSDDLVLLMNKYFEAALQCIHEADGTVVDLVGDAIFALWNAPVAQPDHRQRACRAALRLRQQLVEFDASQRSLPLRTRVGLHAGEVCVGNIGSPARFNYTAVGDCISLTSRLEGLNKRLGTVVLATREIQRAGEDSLLWRLVGHFKLKGFGRVVEIHELLGPTGLAEQTRPWREAFDEALQDFRQRRFEKAAPKFRVVNELRSGIEPEALAGTALIAGDGPSRFYLERIEELLAHPPPYEWIGEVELSEK